MRLSNVKRLRPSSWHSFLVRYVIGYWCGVVIDPQLCFPYSSVYRFLFPTLGYGLHCYHGICAIFHSERNSLCLFAFPPHLRSLSVSLLCHLVITTTLLYCMTFKSIKSDFCLKKWFMSKCKPSWNIKLQNLPSKSATTLIAIKCSDLSMSTKMFLKVYQLAESISTLFAYEPLVIVRARIVHQQMTL